MFYFRCIFYTFYTNTSKMNINEFIEKYNSDNFDSFIKDNATIDYWNDLIKNYKLEKLKFVFPDTVQLSLNQLLKEGKSLFGEDFDGFCERQIEILKIENQYKPQQPKANKPIKRKKTLLEFIHNIENKEAFIQDLKKEFPTEQGKSIKAIVLKLVEVKILIYGTKEFLQFYNELRTCFDRNIGTYQSINDTKIIDNETTDIINKKLNPLIIKHKTI